MSILLHVYSGVFFQAEDGIRDLGRSRWLGDVYKRQGLKSAKEIKATFAKAKMSLDGVSAHCPFWVHTTAWTGSPTVRPFLPADVAKQSPAEIEKWAEDYLLKLLDLSLIHI